MSAHQRRPTVSRPPSPSPSRIAAHDDDELEEDGSSNDTQVLVDPNTYILENGIVAEGEEERDQAMDDRPLKEKPAWMRWVALVLCCLLLFGNFYAYDNPSAISVQMHERLGVPYEQFTVYLNLFYSVYSFPNIFLTLVSGQLMDKFGIPRVLLALSFFVCAGQFLFAYGLAARNLNMMLAGRVLFGIGGESVGVAQASITTMWFRNKELAFALGINLCVARLGSVVNAIVSPHLALRYGVEWAPWAAFFACLISMVSGIVLAVFVGLPSDLLTEPAPVSSKDARLLLDPFLQLDTVQEEGSITAIGGGGGDGGGKDDDPDQGASPTSAAPSLRFLHQHRPSASSSSSRGTQATLDRPQIAVPPAIAADVHEETPLLMDRGRGSPEYDFSNTDNDNGDTIESTSPWKLLTSSLASYPLAFYLLCIECILLYPTVISFSAIASEFLQSAYYPGDPTRAGAVMAIPDTLSGLLVPAFGLWVDRYGHRTTLIQACALLMAGAHAVLALRVAPAEAAMIPLGLAYAMYGTVVWPAIARVVADDRQVAAAYGAATAALNAALTVVPVAVAAVLVAGSAASATLGDSIMAATDAAIVDPHRKYLGVEILFASMALMGALVASVLKWADGRPGPTQHALQSAVSDTALASAAAEAAALALDHDHERGTADAAWLSHSSLPSPSSLPPSPSTVGRCLPPPPRVLHVHPMIRSASVSSLMGSFGVSASVPTSPALSRAGSLIRIGTGEEQQQQLLTRGASRPGSAATRNSFLSGMAPPRRSASSTGATTARRGGGGAGQTHGAGSATPPVVAANSSRSSLGLGIRRSTSPVG
ncbi:major facilitator superfamily domain-containing protein [Blastocladiella britannica]|nr:major facilitator superfamily domain-containing protein [Blastocladiella britannica]